MTLRQLRDFLTERKSASLQEIKGHFRESSGMAESMLQYWISKGNVVKKTEAGISSTCCGKCSGHQREMYHWIEK
ncbi:MAG: hypothetical protein HGB11_01555 [Chlorobiales bacterium]|nr:hypothetical protein [Chlorobiales bacterium]